MVEEIYIRYFRHLVHQNLVKLRDDRDDETRPFCAISADGRKSVKASKARAMRRSIYNLLVVANFDRWDHREFMVTRQDKESASSHASFGSTKVFSVMRRLQYGHRAVSVKMNS